MAPMQRSFRQLLLVLISLSLTGFALAATADPKLGGARLLPQAHVKLADARAIALKTVPGTIVDQELEKEKGGSGLRYSFDIRVGSVTHEVGVDAKDGRVLENSIEGAHPD